MGRLLRLIGIGQAEEEPILYCAQDNCTREGRAILGATMPYDPRNRLLYHSALCAPIPPTREEPLEQISRRAALRLYRKGLLNPKSTTAPSRPSERENL